MNQTWPKKFDKKQIKIWNVQKLLKAPKSIDWKKSKLKSLKVIRFQKRLSGLFGKQFAKNVLV